MRCVEVGVGWRSRRWLSGVCCCVLLACGNTVSSQPTPAPHDSSAGANTTAGAGSSASGGAGSGGRGLLLGGTAGSLVDSDGGELSLGGAEDPGAYQGPVDLCLYDADIPDDWRAAGSVDGHSPCCYRSRLVGCP